MATKRIYLDYAATSPVDVTVAEAMQLYFSKKFGNPGSLHRFGQEVQAAIDRSRLTISKFFDAEIGEIIFTSSATEANNLAIRGLMRDASGRPQVRPHIITSTIEHESVLATCADLEQMGLAEVTYIPI